MKTNRNLIISVLTLVVLNIVVLYVSISVIREIKFLIEFQRIKNLPSKQALVADLGEPTYNDLRMEEALHLGPVKDMEYLQGKLVCFFPYLKFPPYRYIVVYFENTISTNPKPVLITWQNM